MLGRQRKKLIFSNEASICTPAFIQNAEEIKLPGYRVMKSKYFPEGGYAVRGDIQNVKMLIVSTNAVNCFLGWVGCSM